MSYYNPHPKHIAYVMLCTIALAEILSIYQQIGLGIVVIIIGIVTILVINVRLVLEGYKDYWIEINTFLAMVDKVKSPEVRNALLVFFGFDDLKNAKLIENVDNGQGFVSTKLKELPVNSTVMQSIADSILTGTSFSEKEIANRKRILSPNKFRTLQKYFREQGIIKPNNSKSNNMGFSLTRKGTMIMMEFASEAVKLQMKEKQ